MIRKLLIKCTLTLLLNSNGKKNLKQQKKSFTLYFLPYLSEKISATPSSNKTFSHDSDEHQKLKQERMIKNTPPHKVILFLLKLLIYS